MRVSAIVVAGFWDAARAVVELRRFAPRPVVVPTADRDNCLIGRFVATRVDAPVIRIVPARVVVIGVVALRGVMLRVMAPRPVSLLERNTVVVRVWDAEFVGFERRFVVVPSRTADMAGTQAKKPRKLIKIRIFFISGKKFSKFHKCGASEILHNKPINSIKI